MFAQLVEFLKAKNIHNFDDVKSKNEYFKNFLSEFKLDVFKDEFKIFEKIRKYLSGFDGLEALFLFLESLVPHEHGLEDTLLVSVKAAVSDCLEILYRSRQIKTDSNLSHNERHQGWFALSKNIVASLREKPRGLLLQIITPIKDDSHAEEQSYHAIYVSIKYLQNINKFQIILTNGGSEVDKFHEISPFQHSSDRKEYRYAAFEPFDIDPCQEALENYIYLLVSLEYRAGIEGNEEYPDFYLNLLKSVYLRRALSNNQEYFLGFQEKKYTDFKRADLDEFFLSQFTGNCTIHNLKKSIQILFDMDQLTFGLLEDNLVGGLDELISKTLTLYHSTSSRAKSVAPSGFPLAESREVSTLDEDVLKDGMKKPFIWMKENSDKEIKEAWIEAYNRERPNSEAYGYGPYAGVPYRK